jgi:hypothetical protein
MCSGLGQPSLRQLDLGLARGLYTEQGQIEGH